MERIWVLDWREAASHQSNGARYDSGHLERTSTGLHERTLRSEVRCGVPAFLRRVHGAGEERLRIELKGRMAKIDSDLETECRSTVAQGEGLHPQEA